MSNQELLFALADELKQGEELLDPSISLLSSESLSLELLLAAKEDYCAFTTRVANVANAINLNCLQTLMSFIDMNVSMFAESSSGVRTNAKTLDLIKRWPSLLSDFILNTNDKNRAEKLHTFLVEENWPWKVDAEQLKQIINDIRAYSLSSSNPLNVDDELLDPTEKDVSTEIPDDISPKLLATFQEELPQSTAEFSNRIQKLFNKDATLEDLMEARRVAHTLKGAANIVGVVGIANITHYLEDILEILVKKNGLPSHQLSSTLIDAADCLEIMAEAALGISEDPEDALLVLKSLLNWKQNFQQGDFSAIAGTISKLIEPEPTNTHFIGPQPSDTLSSTATSNTLASTQHSNTLTSLNNTSTITNNTLGTLNTTQQEQATTTDNKKTKPPAETSILKRSNIFDKLLDIAGELSSSNLQSQGALEKVLKNAESINTYHHSLHTQMSLLQDLIFTQGLKKPSGGSGFPDDESFDPLEMDQYNELHSTANLLAELIDDVNDTGKIISGQLNEIKELLGLQDQLNKELDQSITAERLISVKTIIPRLQRSVRQTCRATDKKAELVVSGDILDVDNSILENITDPLLHILRNAVDHGIEPPNQRLTLGKSETAEITLHFERVGNNIVISCKDDGCGININEVKNKALELGLITPDQIVTENELYELIVQPGFSTKTEVSQVSGRGVGMNVVAEKITELRGSLNIRSSNGNGTEFTITIPQTLLKTHVVLLQSQNKVFGIISNSFDQIINVDTHQQIEADGKNTLQYNNKSYEMKFINQLMGINIPTKRHSQQLDTALIVDSDDAKSIVVIDQAVGNGNLVIKKLSKYMPNIVGIVGTVLTADGTAAPVFDLKELVKKPSQLISEYLQHHSEQSYQAAIDVLIVDDSSSARRSLSQVAKDIGYDVRTAIDGVEAITLIEEKRPDLVLTDLEMPKMNGLELAAHLRSNNNTKDLPIVMVTSRSTEKHKAQAMLTGVDSYITKPFTNDHLIHEMNQLLTR